MRKSRWLWAEGFFSIFQAFRVCWLGGRFGGGKTSLAVALAASILRIGWVDGVISNFPISFGKIPEEPTDLRNKAIILDEAWLYLKNRKAVEDYAAFLRKANIFLILPSVFPIHPRLSFLRVQRLFNGQVFKLPFWVYKYSLSMMNIKENGYFLLLNPQSIYPAYDTLYIPSNNAGEIIAQSLAMTIGRERKNAEEGRFLGIGEEIEEITEATQNVAEILQETTEKIKRAVRP